MPYIDPDRRLDFTEGICGVDVLAEMIKSPGELNFVLSYLVRRAELGEGYEGFNAKMGVLESVKEEYYRRCVASYEDRKIVLNGDLLPDTAFPSS